MNGFLHCNSVRPLPGRYFAKAMERLQPFAQHPAAWRLRWIVAPQEWIAVDGFGGQIVQQVKLSPGGHVVAIQTAAISGSLSNFSVQVRWDFDGGRELFSNPLIASTLAPTGTSGLRQTLLPEPQLISGDGTVTIIVTNNDTVARQCQVLLKVVEPGGMR